MLHWIPQRGKRNCGQIALAALTGLSLEFIEAQVGHSHGTKTRDLARILRNLGWACPSRCVDARSFLGPPPLAIVHVALERKKRGSWHWAALENGIVADGCERGLMPLAEYPKDAAGRITSYLPVTRPTLLGYPYLVVPSEMLR